MAGQIVPKGKQKWIVRVFLGRNARTGKRLYHNKAIRGSKKDAQKYLNGVLREIDLGIFVEPSIMTLTEYINKWLERAARPRVSKRTADGYEGLLRRYVKGSLGDRKLSQIKPLDIQKVYGEMQLNGLSARVVRHTHSALHNALKQAVKWGMLSRNQSDYVELPKVERKERRVLSPEEAMKFLKVAAQKPFGLLFEFALVTGMRQKNT